MPSAPNAKLRVRIAFLCLFLAFVGLSIGAYYIGDLGRYLPGTAAREEGDVGSRPRQRRTKSAADAAGADNRDTHEFSPGSSSWPERSPVMTNLNYFPVIGKSRPNIPVTIPVQKISVRGCAYKIYNRRRPAQRGRPARGG